MELIPLTFICMIKNEKEYYFLSKRNKFIEARYEFFQLHVFWTTLMDSYCIHLLYQYG